MGGILYAHATTHWRRRKGAYGCRIAIVIGSNRSTAQSSLLMPRRESMCARWRIICKRWGST